MAILTPPAAPRYASARFGPQANTLAHVSPLDKSAQTVELPGVRWMFEAALPAMDETEAEAWTAFLSQLGGQAGRFYAGDPWRIAPRGPAGVIGAHQNDIPNNTMQGAVVGTIGSGGAFPTGWANSFNTANFSIDVVAVGAEAGIEYIDLRFYAPTVVGQANLDFALNSSIPAVDTDQRTLSAYVVRQAGSETGLTNVTINHSFLDGAFVFLGSNQLNLSPVQVGALSGNREILSDTVDEVGTVYSKPVLAVNNSAITTPDITLRIGLPQDNPGLTADAPVRTSGTAVSKPAGPFVEGASQTGSAVVTGGWAPDTTPLLTGDYAAFDLPSGGRSLHKLTADAASDVTGEATLAIYPPLRESPADAAPVLIAPATCVMRLINDDQARWDVDTAGHYRIAFAAVETFDDGS